jgi:hypothetical protein
MFFDSVINSPCDQPCHLTGPADYRYNRVWACLFADEWCQGLSNVCDLCQLQFDVCLCNCCGHIKMRQENIRKRIKLLEGGGFSRCGCILRVSELAHCHSFAFVHSSLLFVHFPRSDKWSVTCVPLALCKWYTGEREMRTGVSGLISVLRKQNGEPEGGKKWVLSSLSMNYKQQFLLLKFSFSRFIINNRVLTVIFHSVANKLHLSWE